MALRGTGGSLNNGDDAAGGNTIGMAAMPGAGIAGIAGVGVNACRTDDTLDGVGDKLNA